MSWTMRTRRRLRQNIYSSPEPWYKHDYLVYGSLQSSYSASVVPFRHYFDYSVVTDVDRKVHPRVKGSKDDGGPFSLKRLRVSASLSPLKIDILTDPFFGTQHQYQASGFGVVSHSSINKYYNLDNAVAIGPEWDSFDFPTTDLASYGNKALSRVDPTRKVAPDVGQFLAELIREGLPSLPLKAFKRVQSLRSLGSEYLNVEFGWKPLLSDISKLFQTYQNIQKITNQLMIDNKKGVRRSGTLSFTKSRDPETDQDWAVQAPVTVPFGQSEDLGAYFPDPLRYPKAWTSTEERVWFAGKGSYVLPSDLLFPPSSSDVSRFVKLLSAIPSPATVYELLPWSWLIDYFANLGDILELAYGRGVGEYTLDYCYLMRKRYRNTYYVAGNFPLSSVLKNPYDSSSRVFLSKFTGQSLSIERETKERIAATPYGFGKSLSDLSPRQMAILTALGLSRQNFI